MPTTVHEIAPDIFRIATSTPSRPVTFIQFLIRDERSLLYHTGPRSVYPNTLEAIGRILNPAQLRYVSWSHLESDECGALNNLLGTVPSAEPVHGEIGVRHAIGDFFAKPVTAVTDNSILELGEKRLRFLITPDFCHGCWDGITTYEETTGTLFCSDLFANFRQMEPMTDKDIVGPAVATIARNPSGYPTGQHTSVLLDRLSALQPKVIAGHHSPAYIGSNAAQALQDLKRGLLDLAGLGAAGTQ